MREAGQEATSRQLWRLNREGRLLLVPDPPAEPITVAQADAALGGKYGAPHAERRGIGDALGGTQEAPAA